MPLIRHHPSHLALRRNEMPKSLVVAWADFPSHAVPVSFAAKTRTSRFAIGSPAASSLPVTHGVVLTRCGKGTQAIEMAQAVSANDVRRRCHLIVIQRGL